MCYKSYHYESYAINLQHIAWSRALPPTHTHAHTYISFGLHLHPSHRLPGIDMTLSAYQAKVTEHPFQIVALKLIRPPFKCYSYQTHVTNAGQSSHNTLSSLSPFSLDILIFDQMSLLDYCNEV